MLKHIFRESQCTSMSAEQLIFLGTRQGGLQCGPPFQAQKKEVFSSPAPDNISESESSSVVSTLCNPMDYTLHGILQARILEWVASSLSRGSSQPRDRTQVSHIAGRLLYQVSHQGSPRILARVAYPFSSRSSQSRNQTGISCTAGNSLPSEPPKKPKNTGEGSLPLLQQIFPTQESNRGLLHCTWILYQLSFQGSPYIHIHTHPHTHTIHTHTPLHFSRSFPFCCCCC